LIQTKLVTIPIFIKIDHLAWTLLHARDNRLT